MNEARFCIEHEEPMVPGTRYRAEDFDGNVWRAVEWVCLKCASKAAGKEKS